MCISSNTQLSNTVLAKQISEAINLGALARNSMVAKDGDFAALYALKLLDGRLADLLDYFCDREAAEQGGLQ